MNINNKAGFNFIVSNNLKNNKNSYSPYSNLRPLSCDTISFGAMKKTEFSGIDLAVINKFKAPIEKFNFKSDFNSWCNEEVSEIKDKKYPARRDEANIQRETILKEWYEYVINENDAYTPPIQLLILDGITKDLKNDNDSIPPVLNKGVLANTIEEIQNVCKENNRAQINFSKLYQLNLQKFYLKDIEDINEDNDAGNKSTDWIVIPSKDNDPTNFESNVDKLKALSHPNWCTKSFNAEPYLSEGDFHIYIEDGKPKLGVRFIGDEIGEIQGELNNSRIPLNYYDTIKEYIDKNNFALNNDVKREVEQAKTLKSKCNRITSDLKEAIKNQDNKTIFNYFGIECEQNSDGTYIISAYRQPDKGITFSDLKINEDKLLKDVKEIKGIADFKYSKATDLHNLQSIGRHANFEDSQVTDLRNLQTIGGAAYFTNSKVTDLHNLEIIKGSAAFYNSQVTDLRNLQTIGGAAYFQDSKVTDLHNLQSIGMDANFEDSQVTDLHNLQSIGGHACFTNSQATDLTNLVTIKGGADFINSKITDLPNIQIIEGEIKCDNEDLLNKIKERLTA